MLCPFFALYEENIFNPQLFRSINGTFVLELLTEFLKIGKANVAEEGFAGVNCCSQSGKIFTIVGGLDALPVYGQVFQKIFKNGLCVYGIAFE
jgi:hypothetical protein